VNNACLTGGGAAGKILGGRCDHEH
jgi:hypothetical protein